MLRELTYQDAIGYDESFIFLIKHIIKECRQHEGLRVLYLTPFDSLAFLNRLNAGDDKGYNVINRGSLLIQPIITFSNGSTIKSIRYDFDDELSGAYLYGNEYHIILIDNVQCMTDTLFHYLQTMLDRKSKNYPCPTLFALRDES